MLTVEQQYVAAYEAAHGETAVCERVGKVYRIANKAGDETGYTERDVRNLVRGLHALAKIKARHNA